MTLRPLIGTAIALALAACASARDGSRFNDHILQTFEDFCIAGEADVFIDERGREHWCPVEDRAAPLAQRSI